MGTAEQARTVIDDNRIGLVAICRGNAKTQSLTELAPAGFLAALTRSDAPSWLEKLPQAADEPLEIYRVRSKFVKLHQRAMRSLFAPRFDRP